MNEKANQVVLDLVWTEENDDQMLQPFWDCCGGGCALPEPPPRPSPGCGGGCSMCRNGYGGGGNL